MKNQESATAMNYSKGYIQKQSLQFASHEEGRDGETSNVICTTSFEILQKPCSFNSC